MKRLLIRLAVLISVVVLGWITIAQAQRGANNHEAENTKHLEGDQTLSPEPVLAETHGTAKPIGTRKNPLRPEPRLPDFPNVIQTSGETVDRVGVASPSRQPAVPLGEMDTSVNTMRSPNPAIRDPFDLRSIANATDSSPAPLVDPKMPQIASPKMPQVASPKMPQVASPKMPPAGGLDFSGGLPNDLSTDNRPIDSLSPQTGPPVQPREIGHEPAREIPRGAPMTMPSTPEPSRLNIDPYRPSASIPEASESRLSPILPGSGVAGESSEGRGTPGGSYLEGAQVPQLTIEKFAPPEIQVGKPATFEVKVTNTGQVPALGVEIRDDVPRGTQLRGTTPRASQAADGGLVWSIGTMNPGEKATVEIEVMPISEGSLGSVATVHFQASASAHSIATKPALELESTAPEQVLLGENVLLTITISNPGSGIARNVWIQERIPPGLSHSSGEELEYEVGDLKPKESRKLELSLKASQPGATNNMLYATGEPNLQAEHQLQINVVSPQLTVGLQGPKRRYLERESIYTLSVSNPGTAPARLVKLVSQLPPGLQFVRANNGGEYNQNERTVHWQLKELPVRETATVELTTVPIELGEQTLRVSGNSFGGLNDEAEQLVLVEGIAALRFELIDINDPIEVNGETTYEIRILNQGSKVATNVQLVAMLPPEMSPVVAEGPTGYSIDRNRVIFEGLSRLAPKADKTYRVRVKGIQPGDLRLSVQLNSDELNTPVTKEESTRVYAD